MGNKDDDVVLVAQRAYRKRRKASRAVDVPRLLRNIERDRIEREIRIKKESGL